jgi:signal transduction histidine kinase
MLLPVVALQSQVTTDTLLLRQLLDKVPALSTTQPDSSLRLLRDVRITAERIHYAYGVANALKLTGNIYISKGVFDTAMRYYEEAITWCDSTGPNRNMIANLYTNIASGYEFLGEHEQAVSHYQKAIAAAEKYSSLTPLASIYNNLAAVLNETGQYAKALYYLDIAEKEAEKIKVYLTWSNILLNKANAYMFTGENNKSLHYLKKALLMAQQHRLADVEVLAYNNLAALALRQSHFTEAKQHLQDALSIKTITNPYYHNLAVLSLGEVYMNLNKYDSAAYYLQQALKTANKSHISRDFMRANEKLAIVYAATGNYKKAYHHEQVFRQTADSLLTLDKTEAVNQMEVKYRTAQKDKEIANKQLQLKERDRQLYRKNILIGSITAGAALMILALAFIYRSYRHKQRLQQNQMQIMVQQQEIRELKAIMDGEEKERTRMARELHDSAMVEFSVVKMNLNTLLNEPDENLKKENLHQVQLQLNGAISGLRNTAHNLMPDMLLQEGLLEALYYFCNNLQRNSHVQINLEHYGTIPPLQPQFELSVYRIVQELMQNMIKHARATEAIVQLSCHEDMLHITVEDNGIGIEEDQLPRSKGMGLKSIQARMRTLNGQMEIDSKKGIGTTLTLEFDITPVKREQAATTAI